MIIAGEASGDMRAAGLARALKELNPQLRLTGIGGNYMRQAGVECFMDITQLAVIGIAEVVKNLSRIKKVFDQTIKQIDATHPDCVVLVDYPGFNLRLASVIKKRGIKIIYYISPQVWAWREKRVLKIKKLVDRMIVLFPFEQNIYSKYGMKVDYVGHPLVDEIIVDKNRAEILNAIGQSESKTTIGLMPGSRAKEVDRHLPCMLEAAQILYKENNQLQFILLKSSSIPFKIIESILSQCHCERSEAISEINMSFPRKVLIPDTHSCLQESILKNIPIKIYDGPIYDGINATDAVMVASGTATLEAALLKKPMVIIYKTSWLTYYLARALIKIPYIGLVNIVAGKKVADELIQNNATAINIADAIKKAMNNRRTIDDLAALKASLGRPGASQRAARIILEEIK